LQPTDWPTFFYKDNTYNRDDEIEGLLRSELLVQVCQLLIAHRFPIHRNASQAYKCIFLGPSAWLRKDGKSKTTRASKAVLCEMDRVTARSLAYVAVLVCLHMLGPIFQFTLGLQTYFAMSSSENNQKSGTTFELSSMYWQIVTLLEDDELQDEADALLLWWNQ
jgi:Family of unknown function (DUF6698)